MYVRRLEWKGFGGLPDGGVDLDRAAKISGGARELARMADALALAFAPWDDALHLQLAKSWGVDARLVEQEEIEGEVFVAHRESEWETAPGHDGLVQADSGRRLTASMSAVLDPPQYGRLREAAARDPRLVDAIADGAELELTSTAWLRPDGCGMTVEPLSMQVGGVPFPIGGPELPPWVLPFLKRLGGRVQLGRADAGLWLSRSRSYARTDHDRFQAAATALEGEPFGFGRIRVMPEGPAVVADDAIVPLALLGPAAIDSVAVVGAVLLTGAEILVVQDPPPAAVDWLCAQAEAPDSALEQVVLLGVERG